MLVATIMRSLSGSPYFHLFQFCLFFWIFRPIFKVSGLIFGFQASSFIFGSCWLTDIMPDIHFPSLNCTFRPWVRFEALVVCSKRWLRSNAFRMACVCWLVLACLTLDLVIAVPLCWSKSWPKNPASSSKHVPICFWTFFRLFFWLPFFLNFFFKFFFCLSFFLTFFSLFFFVAVLFFSFFCPFGRLIDFLGFRVLESTQAQQNDRKNAR